MIGALSFEFALICKKTLKSGNQKSGKIPRICPEWSCAVLKPFIHYKRSKLTKWQHAVAMAKCQNLWSTSLGFAHKCELSNVKARTRSLTENNVSAVQKKQTKQNGKTNKISSWETVNDWRYNKNLNERFPPEWFFTLLAEHFFRNILEWDCLLGNLLHIFLE